MAKTREFYTHHANMDFKKMKYRLWIFDLDGTLLNTLADLADATNHALRALGFRERSTEEVLSFVGNGNRKLMERSLPEGSSEAVLEKALEEFHAYYRRHYTDKTTIYPGLPQLLAELKQKGCLLAVVTNKADYAAQDLCRIFFPDVFDMVLGDREGIRRKPDPQAVELILRTLQIPADEAVYIGDSEVDVQTAVNSGLDLISAAWGFRPIEVLREAGASRIALKPEALIGYCTEGREQ